MSHQLGRVDHASTPSIQAMRNEDQEFEAGLSESNKVKQSFH